MVATIAQAHGAQYPSAAGHHAAGQTLRAGVEHFARQACGAIQPIDAIAAAYRVGIAGRSEHHAQRGALIPPRLDTIESAVERCLAQRGQIAVEARQDRLCFGVAEATIEFQNRRCAIGPDHQPGI